MIADSYQAHFLLTYHALGPRTCALLWMRNARFRTLASGNHQIEPAGTASSDRATIQPQLTGIFAVPIERLASSQPLSDH